MITPKNVIRHELIGLAAEVVGSANSRQVGTAGEIVDETRNTVTIAARNGEKTIPKEGSTFMFTLPDGKKVRVDGGLLLARPPDRMKKKTKKW